ncbi:FkbM family methyltransferase [Mesorhizobium caraganae]|uniref:FkbM family methyltransferase n=1 Tax=Mesorhizobium caraganae TaxID=483206 RepID=UPI001780BCFA|nr:FkbM family methyltransferase [Mesorhizobium caraganae]
MSFPHYIARDRVFGDFVFDFHIANEVAKEWYDGSPQQFMPERQWCCDHIRPGMTVVDCGAHHGMMTLIFANQVGPAGRVIAYEALPANADVIRANVILNGLKNVIVRPVGVGSRSDELGYNSNHGNIIVDMSPGDAVKIVALDNDLPAETRVDFLKIDVEGFELEALRGMRNVLAMRPIVDLEIHNFISPDRRATLAELAKFFDRYKFTVLGNIWDKPLDVGMAFNVAYLAQFENPHLFCEPI